MGLGGFFMHPRVGLKTPYLSDEFLDRVGDCIDEAKKNGIYAYLYDEDRWPSGTAGGFVTSNPKYQSRSIELRFGHDIHSEQEELFLRSYLIKLNDKGELLEYRQCDEKPQNLPDFTQIWCWRVLEAPQPRFNDTPYVDALNPEAIKAFLDCTHEKYYSRFGQDFGKAVPAIFTDEPRHAFPKMPIFAKDKSIFSISYTDDFPTTYQKRWGADFFATLPEIFWDLEGGRHSVHRYRYHEHAAELFAAAYADTIGQWCQDHHIAFTGHLMLEQRLESQTRAVGDAMRAYRAFQIPGMDILCDDEELSTAKQVQSAARQFGRNRMLSELDGVTDWDFPFYGHKGHGDWQAALGVNLRVPHLSWLSMGGEAKRDYPAPIGPQSAWYKKYGIIADHFARLGVAMTQGRPLCRIAVVHPIESFWLLYGPQGDNALKLQQAEDDFASLLQWLLKNLLDFDFLAESLLPIQNVHVEGKCLCVGAMKYEVVLVPPCITLRSTTLDALEAFRKAGGTVVFAGERPTLCDAMPSERPRALTADCPYIQYNKRSLLETLEPWRDVKVIISPEGASSAFAHKTDGTPISGLPDFIGKPMEGLLHQQRECEDGSRLLFIANTQRTGNATSTIIFIKGNWQLEYLDTLKGTMTPLAAEHDGGWTRLNFVFQPHGHILLRMVPSSVSTGSSLPQYAVGDDFLEPQIVTRVAGRNLPVTLDEPNALMLDLPEARLDGGEWLPQQEILRLDTFARKHFGLPLRQSRSVQPWVHLQEPRHLAKLELRYTIDCRHDASGIQLAMEQPEKAHVFLDGKPVPFIDDGFWIDPCIRKAHFPDLSSGVHSLSVIYDYDTDTPLERIYLLGKFGVFTEGDRCVIGAPVNSLHWGDIAPQGLPFFGGNLTYHASFNVPRQGNYLLQFQSRLSETMPELCVGQARREIDFASFKGALVEATLDGRFIGDIAFAPFVAELGELSQGEHKLDLKLFCTRVNGCGAVHLTNRLRYSGPASYRTSGNHFSYDYTLIPQGILRSPMILQQ